MNRRRFFAMPLAVLPVKAMPPQGADLFAREVVVIKARLEYWAAALRLSIKDEELA